MSTLTPLRNACSWGPWLTPPKIAAPVTGVCVARSFRSSRICAASSRVGARTSARVRPRGPPMRWFRMGSRNAAVLPLPVWAHAMRSRPSRAAGMASPWMPVGRTKPRSLMPRSRLGCSLRAVNGTRGLSPNGLRRAGRLPAGLPGDARGVSRRAIKFRIFVVRVGLAGRNAQVRPRLAPQRFREKYDLADVKRKVRQRSMESLDDRHRLLPDGDRRAELRVGQCAERSVQRAPPLFPFLHQLRAPDDTPHEFLVALAPGLFAVGREKVGEPRQQVAGHVPADHRNGVAAVQILGELRLVHLRDGTLSVGLVAIELAANRVNDGGGGHLNLDVCMFAREGQSWAPP